MSVKQRKQIIKICIVGLTILIILVVMLNVGKIYEKEMYEIKEVGKVTHSKETFEEYSTSIFYPKTEYKKLNKEIGAFIEKEPNFKSKEKFIYYIDYESTNEFNQYINVTFHTIIFNNSGEEIKSNIHTITYDKKKNKIVALEDVFRRDYKNMIQSEIVKNKKETKVEEISGFKVGEKGITLYFNEAKANSLHLNYSEIIPYIQLKNEEIPSLYQGEMSEVKKFDVDPNKPMVALTFDDGPNQINTPKIIAALEKNNANATFFLLGLQIVKYPNIVKDIHNKGFEIGSHSFRHRNLSKISDKEVYEEIVSTQDAIYKIIGKDPVLLRFPYGAKPKLDIKIFDLDIAYWNMDTLDWRKKSPKAIVARVLNEVHDGSIILMHDIYENTAQATEEIIPALKAKGYQIVDLSTLMKYRH